MDINEFVEKFKQQFIDADKIELNKDTDFRKIKSYDSLTGMAILVMIEESFGKVIQEDVYRKLNTPSEIYDYITKL